MKRLVIMLTLLLLLAGCTPQSASSSTPALSPSADAPAATPTPTVVPTPTPEPQWWEGITLEELDAAPDYTGTFDLDLPYCRLAALPAQDITLYVSPSSENGVLLRYGAHLQYFDMGWRGAPIAWSAPELHWADFDGDGSEELAVIHNVSAERCRELDLHMLEWDSAQWIDHPFGPAELDPLLLDALDYEYDSATRTAKLTLGYDIATYTIGPGDGGGKDYHLVERFGSSMFYQIQGASIRALYGVTIMADTEVTRLDVATISAAVRYGGEGFSLDELTLSQNFGV